jgi:hexosaminidase
VLYTLSASALWPIPRSLSTGSSSLKLSSSFKIHVASVYPSDVHDAAKRTRHFLFHDHLARLVPDRGRSDESTLKHAPILQGLKLMLDSDAKETKGIAAETIRPLEERDEAYTLTVPIHGEATITAKSALGLWRGLTTFSQLWYTHQGTGAVYTLEAPVTIADEPAYVSLMAPTSSHIIMFFERIPTFCL